MLCSRRLAEPEPVCLRDLLRSASPSPSDSLSGHKSLSSSTMPLPVVILNFIFFPLIIASNLILWRQFRKLVLLNIWPTERFFWTTRRKPGHIFSVLSTLRQAETNAINKESSRMYRRCRHLIYLGCGLGVAALITLLGFSAWLFSTII